ncbi:hypothetical protein N2152v2_007206 [Parachlorella kessleri]
MIELPAQVQQALDKAASETNRKLVKQKGQELTERLRHMSRTRHRGGVHPNLREQQWPAEGSEPPPHRRGKRQTRRQLLNEIARAAALPVEGGAGVKPDVEHYWGDSQRQAVSQIAEATEDRAARYEAGSLYDEAASLAYAATRMPACYAALRRVLGEVAARRPGWRPETMLDFGAGPGTATWAAQQVWRDAPLQVSAVEPSPYMTWLGQRVWTAHRQAFQEHQATQQAQQAAHQAQQAAEQAQQQGQGQGQGQEQAIDGEPGAGGAAPAAAEVQWQATWRGRELSQARLDPAVADNAYATTPGGSVGGFDLPPAAAEAAVFAAGSLVESRLENEGREGHDEELEAGEEGHVPAPAPRLRWLSRLPRAVSSSRKRYDMVVAAYVLGELRTDEQRRKAVEELWQRTDGLLVLVEPGTPAGFAHIIAARSQVLAAAAPAATSETLGAAPSTSNDKRSSDNSSSSSGSGGRGGREGVAGREAVRPQGAHVLAPCPHDGRCPLLGRRSWCHFVQRFERTDLQRKTKAVEGRAPRVYQDERYSYVVLARGPRPATVDQQVWVAGSYLPQAPEDPQQFLRLPGNLHPRSIGRLAEVHWQPAAVEADIEEGEGSGAPRGSISDEEAEEEEGEDSEELDEATRQLILESILADMEDSEAEDSTALAAQLREQLFQHEGPASGPMEKPATAPSEEASENAQAAAAEAVLPIGEALLPHTRPEHQGQQQEEQLAGHAVGGLQGVGPAGACEQGWEAGDPQQQQQQGGLAAAVASSSSWSRVLRTPRKRGGHVVLDLCSAVQAGGAAAPGGLLLRQIVSRGSAQRLLGGPAPYRLARSVRWGDLWPLHYQRRLKAAEPPPAEAFQQQ